MFRIIKSEIEGEKEIETKIEEKFETRESAKEWIDNDIEPYLRDQEFHFFDSKEGEYYDFYKLPKLDDEDPHMKWILYLIKEHE